MSLRRIYPLSPSAHTSAKIHALISHLTRLSPNIKSVVFSQFTSFLDLISAQLNKAGIPHLRLDGTMQQKARAEILASFNKTDNFDSLKIINSWKKRTLVIVALAAGKSFPTAQPIQIDHSHRPVSFSSVFGLVAWVSISAAYT
jgi:Helicase conserved C-terminal domain